MQLRAWAEWHLHPWILWLQWGHKCHSVPLSYPKRHSVCLAICFHGPPNTFPERSHLKRVRRRCQHLIVLSAEQSSVSSRWRRWQTPWGMEGQRAYPSWVADFFPSGEMSVVVGPHGYSLSKDKCLKEKTNTEFSWIKMQLTSHEANHPLQLLWLGRQPNKRLLRGFTFGIFLL